MIETDNYEDFEFFEDGIGEYLVGKDVSATSSGGWIPLYFKKVPKEKSVLVPCKYRGNDYANGYNQALIDCGVIEDDSN